MINNELEHKFVKINGIFLHVVLCGPKAGEPVILLHGFPEFWRGWVNQIGYLAAQGFRVIVPDQRGYNLSDKPRGRSAYTLDVLAQDIIGLIAALGYDQVYLAGHDWGAAVTWWLAAHFPEKLRRFAILNVPYPTVLKDAITQGNWTQLRKSWYIFFFQFPWLAERGFRQQNQGEGRNILLRTAKKGTFSDEELAHYEKAWKQPGAVTGMLNWYRAAGPFLVHHKTPPAGSIQVPGLMLWGEQDLALGMELVQPSLDLCADGRLITFPEASHWLQHDEVEAVNQHLAGFFSSE